MQFLEVVSHIIFYIVLLFFILACVFIVKDIFASYKKRKEKQKQKNISFDLYREFQENADKYEFHAAYGVSHSMILFISEAPYFIEAAKNINKYDYPLTKGYRDATDGSLKKAYINIATELANIIANSGKLLVNHCSFYCQNSSESFHVNCNSSTIQQYCKYATMIHDIHSYVKMKNIESPEIMESLDSMYQEFVEYFEHINLLITFNPIEKGDK